ncbi:zinc finger protein 438 isoform X2 [Amblyraja radiata]|uniref:zinc finger protein 438 isoform X2 n=2 Tax=Amblyraja radiata TaxID=386614 RepID=UPI001402523E|nr:zinc finger protein 438 isoform X2 [Amblyraja radiata]
MDERGEDGGAHAERIIMADASRCKHRKQANPRRKHAKDQILMNEDPNGCLKEISEESSKKEPVFQDVKLAIHGEGTRESDERGILQNEIKIEEGNVDNSKKQTFGEMQDFTHDSSMFSDAQGSSSGLAGQKRTLQAKGHFRTIAPKASPSPAVMTASILPPSTTISGISCGSNISSSIQANTFSPKPIIMPARNYALMPIAGKEGTYSLVALPQVAAAPSQASLKVDRTSVTCTGQSQVSTTCSRSSVVSLGTTTPQVATTEKLPIPRYQSVWAKPAVKLRGSSKLAVVKPSNLHCLSRATSVQVQPTAMPGHSRIRPSVAPPKTELLVESDKVAFAAAETTVCTTLPRDADMMLRHSPTSKSDKLKRSEINRQVSLTVSTSMDRPTLNATPAKDSCKPNPDLLSAACNLSSWSVVQPDQQTPLISKQNQCVGALPLMQFGNSVQFIAPSPAPKGKVPILPYSQVKRTIFINPKQSQAPVTPSTQFVSRIRTASSGNGELTDASKNICVVSDFHRVGAQKPRGQLTFIPAERISPHTSKKVIINRLKRPSSSTLKHRLARKRKATDNVAISKTKRLQTCDLSKMQEDEKAKCDFSQQCGPFKVKEETVTSRNSEKTAAVLKKFCNIMPKPVAVMQAVAPLTFTGGVVAVQNHDSLKSGAAPSNAPVSNIGNLVQAANASTNLQGHLDVQAYKCNVCHRGFQFKHHLHDHLNIHSKKRPYCCRICHKAYSHSGSLSTHMKRCHSEVRRKKLMCCEFCSKQFGNIGVYFFHLKEIHKVLISNEHSSNFLTQDKNDQSGKPEQMETMSCLPPSNRKQAEGEQSGGEEGGPSALQIKCARCQAVTPTFVDMKLHLLCAHEEALQLSMEEGAEKEKSGCISGFPIYSSVETEQELFKHAANYWKQFGEKKNLFKCGVCEEAFNSAFKLKKHMVLHYKQQLRLEAANSSALPKVKKLQFLTSVGFNCVLCKRKSGSKSELFSHWQSFHRCKDPAVLWTVFHSLIEHCRIDEEQNELSVEQSAVSAEPFCRRIAGPSSLCDLHEGRRVVDQCKVHLSSCTGGTETSLDSCQLTCPFCSKAFFCTNCRSSSSEEVVFHQEDVVHQCPKCLLKSPLPAEGLGSQVFCTSSKDCG